MTAVLPYNFANFIPYSKHDYRAQTTKLPPGTGLSVAWSVRYLLRADSNAFEMTVPNKNTRAYLQRVLEKVSVKDKAVQIGELLQRSILCADALVDGVKEREKLSYREAFIISLHSILTTLFTKTSPLYLKKNERFTRAVIIDKVKNRFILLSKKLSLRQTGGTCKKVTHAFVTSFENFQVKQAMRITNKTPAEFSLELHKQRVESMKKEAALAQRVNGDIYAIVDRTSERGLPKLDWVEDEYESDLYDYLNMQRTFSDAQEKSLLTQIAIDLFHKLHSQGIVHYDIKPENVLFTLNPDDTIRAKLTDFGLSFDRQFFLQHEGRSLFGYGTSDCSSPETFRPECRLQDPLEQGKADDMYAMGCLVFELIFKEKVPWFTIVKAAVETKDPSCGNIVYKLQVQGYKRVTFIALNAITPHKARLSGICRDLLDPNPQTRLKGYQLINRLLLD